MPLSKSVAVVDVLSEHPEETEAERADVYRLLATLLYAPTPAALLAQLAAIEPPPTEAERAPLADALRLLRLAAREAREDAVDDEFHTLFIGLGRGELVPYGSWYLTGFLMDRPLAALRRDLAALGIDRQPQVREPEDHAAALCETMALLCGTDGSALGRQAAFFTAHIEPWLGVFFSDLQEASSACFYRSVGHLGEQFFEFERKYLSIPASGASH